MLSHVCEWSGFLTYYVCFTVLTKSYKAIKKNKKKSVEIQECIMIGQKIQENLILTRSDKQKAYYD